MLNIKFCWQSHAIAMIPFALLLLGITYFNQAFKAPPTNIVHTIHTFKLAPPPPPPPEMVPTQPVVSVKPMLPTHPSDVSLRSTPFEMNVPKLAMTMDYEPDFRDHTEQPVNTSTMRTIPPELSLGELDETPRLISSLNHLSLPRSLIRRGITTATLSLEITIDTKGQARLASIKALEYPQLKSLVHKLVKQALFTVPKQGGQPVKTRYIWNMKLHL